MRIVCREVAEEEVILIKCHAVTMKMWLGTCALGSYDECPRNTRNEIKQTSSLWTDDGITRQEKRQRIE